MPEEGDDDPGPSAIFPNVDIESWRERLFALCWGVHGGSGLHCDVGTAMNLLAEDANWMLERIARQRKKEAHDLEQAARR